MRTPAGAYLYDSNTLDYLETVRCFEGEITETSTIFAWSPDGSQFATLYSPCVGVEIRDTETNAVEQTFPTPEDSRDCSDPFRDEPDGSGLAPQQMVWSADGRYLAVRGTISVPTRLWDLDTGELGFSTSEILPWDLVWSPEGHTLAAVYDCLIEQWTPDASSFELLFEIPCNPPPNQMNDDQFFDLSWSSQNQIAVSGSGRNGPSLFILDIATSEFFAYEDGIVVDDISWSPDGNILAIASSPGIVLLDKQGNRISEITVEDPWIEMAWHPNNEWLYVNSYLYSSTQLAIYDISTGEIINFIHSCVRWREQDPSFDCESYIDQ
ncbi:MAG: WD40 repeat domain-containing protein [Aggregatilineales bacterium]